MSMFESEASRLFGCAELRRFAPGAAAFAAAFALAGCLISMGFTAAFGVGFAAFFAAGFGAALVAGRAMVFFAALAAGRFAFDVFAVPAPAFVVRAVAAFFFGVLLFFTAAFELPADALALPAPVAVLLLPFAVPPAALRADAFEAADLRFGLVAALLAGRFADAMSAVLGVLKGARDYTYERGSGKGL